MSKEMINTSHVCIHAAPLPPAPASRLWAQQGVACRACSVATLKKGWLCLNESLTAQWQNGPTLLHRYQTCVCANAARHRHNRRQPAEYGRSGA